MAEQKFAWFPVTMERPLTNRVLLANAAFYDPDIREAAVEDDYSGHEYTVATVVALSDQEFRFLTETDEMIILRPTRPDDAAASDRFANRIPLPVEIIGAVMTNAIAEPTVAAAVDEQGQVHTMILETGLGLYARYSATWIRMTDISPIEQLDIINVPADDLDIYDNADQRGETVNIRYLHPLEQPNLAGIEVTPPAPVIASVAPIIASVADLGDAVEYAASNPEARWYVERRWRSLGGEQTGVTLPWLDEP